MFKNKDLGLKVADNKEEAFWTTVKEEAQKRIESMQHEIVINQAVIELAEKKIKNKEMK